MVKPIVEFKQRNLVIITPEIYTRNFFIIEYTIRTHSLHSYIDIKYIHILTFLLLAVIIFYYEPPARKNANELCIISVIIIAIYLLQRKCFNKPFSYHPHLTRNQYMLLFTLSEKYSFILTVIIPWKCLLDRHSSHPTHSVTGVVGRASDTPSLHGLCTPTVVPLCPARGQVSPILRPCIKMGLLDRKYDWMALKWLKSINYTISV